ncbi:MAG: C_GCAxxG_C_C family protein [Clostridia bacterium]|nr:C_GCAxxG_C_C family protein [Clostridia bacterium]MBQ2191030.1 C_GCAxxG_C_C family protein [Clostridia bacterium]MBQ3938477.1 C_GCAxxG_C_C family protein [Clostridia bacterium]MBQ5488714.1 C_GCAxxG_C_C family protein [Clostridia bacterium]
MKDFIKKAEELRATVTPHYNCAQSVVIPFAETAGVPEETARLIAANFGGGMKRASVCGAVTGGLMALGLFGVDDAKTIAEYHRRLKQSHSGFLDCADLLRINAEAGGEKKPHCDAMVYECVSLVETILKEKGKI